MKKQGYTCQFCGKTAHHRHFIDGNPNNVDPSNIQRLCVLCHCKIHGNTPNVSDMRRLVSYFVKIQKARIVLENSIDGFRWIELIVPNEFYEMHKALEELESKFDKDIKKWVESHPDPHVDWMKKQKGVSHRLIAKVLGEIEWNRLKSESSLWKWAGLAPGQIKKKKVKAEWNHRLKSYMYQLTESINRSDRGKNASKYKEVYQKEKEKQMKKKGLPKGHAHNRALRKEAKVFLRDLYLLK